jgi:hypothetical protein
MYSLLLDIDITLIGIEEEEATNKQQKNGYEYINVIGSYV